MEASGVPLICYFDGKLSDEDKNAKYIGGATKGGRVPKSILFTRFKKKIQELINLPSNGMEIKIKCGVRFDELLIGMDVDDDNSLRFVMDHSKVILAYILKYVPPVTTFAATQWGDPLPPSASIQSRDKNLIDGTSDNKSVEVNTTEVKPPDNDGMNADKYASPSQSKLREWFPETLVPLLTKYENPKGDGNCGFRALCMALGRDESEWSWMRAELVKEIESKQKSYDDLFGRGERAKLVDGISHLEGPAPDDKWMDMPYTGFVFAQAFKVVLVHYSKTERNCWTFTPFLSPPKAEDVNMKVLGIGFVENNRHYIKLDFGDADFPLPPIPILKNIIHFKKVDSWKRLLAPRFEAFIAMNIPELQVNKYSEEVILLDGVSQSNVDERGTYSLSSFINYEGITSSGLRKHMKWLQSEHEHSEGSSVNMPEKMRAESNVDNYQIIMSVRSHTSTFNNMLDEANQVSSQLSSHSGVYCQITNPLTRNHKENEPDEVNRQKNMLCKEIEFTFQRKETVISGQRSAPIPAHDKVDTSMRNRFFHSTVDHLHKGMGSDFLNEELANMSITNREVNQGNGNMVCEENGHTSQIEEMLPLSDVLIDSRDYGFVEGREFPNINSLKNALSDMAIETGREYKHVRTSPSKLIMKCRDSRCDWSIQATSLQNSPAFKVVKYQESHTCSFRTDSGDKDHPQATVKWILSKVQSYIEKNPDMEPTKIVEEMKGRYGIKISYNKAVKVKTQALNLMRNRLKDAYSHPEICRALIKNLEHGGTICRLGLSSDGSSFQHLFWAFPACIDALRNHLLPLVYVRGVDTEIGVLIYAYGVDSANVYDRPIHVGFARCVRDDVETWEAFLGWLKEFVLRPTSAEAGNSNKKNTIPLTIVTDFRETAVTRAVQTVLPHLHHFFEPESLLSLFQQKFTDNNLWAPWSEACETFSLEKCESALEEINSKNKEAYEWLESVGSKCHWARAFSPNKHVVFASRYFTDQLEYTVARNKMSIVEIVESSRELVARYFSERRSKAELMSRTTGLTPRVLYGFEEAKKYLPAYKVKESINGHNKYYQVTSKYDDNTTWVVDLEERSCTCGKFQAREYPCHHAFVVILHLELDGKDYVTHRWYSLDTYRTTYAGSLPPPIRVDISQWCALPVPLLLPPRRTQVGRPRKLQKIKHSL